MKVVQLKYKGIGHRRFFYVSENESASLVIADIYTQNEGLKNIEFRHIGSGLWDIDFTFKVTGKYAIVVSEDELKLLTLIVTIG